MRGEKIALLSGNSEDLRKTDALQMDKMMGLTHTVSQLKDNIVILLQRVTCSSGIP